MIRSYEKIASQYDRMHQRWLRYAGGEAQAALEASLISRITPRQRVLDAGCGTGHFSCALLSRFDNLSLTLLDTRDQMLAHTGDVRANRVCGSLLDMPFHDDQFDIAVAAWAIEATGNEAQAISELMRVVRPGGRVIVAFCATEPAYRLSASVLRKGVEFRRTGRFLDTKMVQAAFRAAGAGHVIRHRCNGSFAVMDVQRGVAPELSIAA